jgi:hypothetical protein
MVLLVGRWIVFNDWTYTSRVPRRAAWRTTDVLVPGEFLGTWESVT